MKKVKAEWYLRCYINCPHCDRQLDLTSDTPETYEEGWIYNQIQKSFNTDMGRPIPTDIEIQCFKCGKDFEIESIGYMQ